MAKWTKAIRAFRQILANPYVLNQVLDAEDTHAQVMQVEQRMPNGLPEIPFVSLLPSEGLTVRPFAFLDGGSLPTDLALIRLLAKFTRAQSYFEIGTWRGESVMQAAECFEQAHTLNLSAAEMQARNWDPAYIALHGHFSKQHPRVKAIEGDSRHFDFAPFKAAQDLVFVDGDHHYDSALLDSKRAFELRHPDRGIILWHDYAHSPETVRWNVFRAIWEACPPAERRHLYAISNSLCAVYWPHYQGETRIRRYPATPDPGFEIHLSPLKR
jgi:predicted O-methyltransferase YrrM